MNFSKQRAEYVIKDNSIPGYKPSADSFYAHWSDFLVRDPITSNSWVISKAEVHTFAGEAWKWDKDAATVIRATLAPPSATTPTAPAIDAATVAKIADLLSQAQKLLGR